jgi:voltage-gated potassium channel
LFIIFGGSVGYHFIEGYEWVDAYYMTVITVSTVGFREISELTTNGKIFTTLLIFTSLGTFAFAITAITTFLFGGKYKKYMRESKQEEDIEKIANHIIICGFGRVGRQVAEDLSATGTSFLIIEQDNSVIENAGEELNYLFLSGSATEDSTLKKAKLDQAKALITCLPNDADNVYVVLSAREYVPSSLIISRASTESAVKKLKMAGANNVILPDSIGGSHMASLISNPDVMEFLDIVRVRGTSGSNINSISFSELPKELQNKTIGELEAKKMTGVTIIGFKTPDGDYVINPDFETHVVPHSKLFVLGTNAQIDKFKQLFRLNH